MKLPTPTKLTLRLDSALIDRAKHYAREQDRSLSQLVADYFSHLAPGSARKAVVAATASAASKRSPTTAQLRGALRSPGGRRSAAIGRADHRAHLEEKYL